MRSVAIAVKDRSTDLVTSYTRFLSTLPNIRRVNEKVPGVLRNFVSSVSDVSVTVLHIHRVALPRTEIFVDISRLSPANVLIVKLFYTQNVYLNQGHHRTEGVLDEY